MVRKFLDDTGLSRLISLIKGMPDDKTIEYDSVEGLRLKDGGITKDKLDPSLADEMGGGDLSVSVDNSTIEFSDSKLRVKDGGVGREKLNSTVADDSTTQFSQSTGLLVKDGGLTPAKASSLQAWRNQMGLGNTLSALPIANGGTGATTAEQARENLGIPLPLSIANGGTGASTVEQARDNLGLNDYVLEIVKNYERELFGTYIYGSIATYNTSGYYVHSDISSLTMSGFSTRVESFSSRKSIKPDVSGVYEITMQDVDASSPKDQYDIVLFGKATKFNIDHPYTGNDYIHPGAKAVKLNLDSNTYYGFYTINATSYNFTFSINRIA